MPRFPLNIRPLYPFSGPQADARCVSFRAPRDGGRRLHAACDLIVPIGTPIYAVAAGVVENPKSYFYEGTYEISIRHPGIGVIRYGEVAQSGPTLRAGQQVAEGEHIANVGRLNSGSSMLHFEYYSGRSQGPLSTGIPPFRRRDDLQDPTALLTQWLEAMPR
jgi:murein DD-endopeptidase MepM/ murein hydrolase activator NlpD